jgi:antitoxin component of MazEF toxin-antitoxin module
MERKIISLANSLVVSLPQKYVQKEGIKKGEIIDVIEKDSSLLITPIRSHAKKTRVIRLNNATLKQAKRMLDAAYKTGCKSSRILCTLQQQTVLEDYARGFLGTIIIESTKGEFTWEGIIEVGEDEFHKIIRQVFHIIAVLGKDIQSSTTLQNKTTPQNKSALHNKIALQSTTPLSSTFLESLPKRKIEFFYLNALSMRCMHTGAIHNIKETNIYFSLVSLLDTIGDLLFRLSTLFKQHTKEDLLFLGKINVFFSHIEKSFFSSMSMDNAFTFREHLFDSQQKMTAVTSLLSVIAKLMMDVAEVHMMLECVSQK